MYDRGRTAPRQACAPLSVHNHGAATCRPRRGPRRGSLGIHRLLDRLHRRVLETLTLTQAAALLRAKRVSPVDLTLACLERIERVNPSLNAFITVQAESALEEARAREAEQHRGAWRGPLHGIPIALKDNIDTAGVPTTAASELFKDRVPS